MGENRKPGGSEPSTMLALRPLYSPVRRGIEGMCYSQLSRALPSAHCRLPAAVFSSLPSPVSACATRCVEMMKLDSNSDLS